VIVAENDPAVILASIGRLGWRLAIVIVFPAILVAYFDALGWRYAFTRDRVPLGTLMWTRLVGEAFNLTTPTAALGGEAVKTWLLRDRVDRSLAEFYLQQPRRLALSIFYHFMAWLLGAVEGWMILWFLGTPVSLVTATVIEAFGTGIRFATFLIPGSLGALEGGYAATFAALGLGGTMGVTFSLVRRLREIVWIAVGLIAFALLRVPRPPDPSRGI